MFVENAKPDPQLEPFVYRYVQRESDPRAPVMIEPVVARLGAMLEFQFADPYDVPVYGINEPNLSIPVTVIGPMPARRVRILIKGRVQALAVLFRPLGFYSLFGVPVSPLAGTGTDGHAVMGAGVSALYERLGNTASFQDRVKYLNEFLLATLGRRRAFLQHRGAFEYLLHSGHPKTVEEAARHAGLSSRQLERRALEYAGVTPKMMTKIQRFQKALRLKAARNMSWMEIAHAADYHDQMHMIRDFRVLAGDTPGRVIEQISAEHLISFM